MNLKKLAIVILVFSFSIMSHAVPTYMVYQGQVFDPSGNPLEEASVDFKVSVFAPGGTCLLYEENHTGKNMTSSGGVFSLEVGNGVVTGSDPGIGLYDAFNANHTSVACYSTPGRTDKREVKVEFTTASAGTVSLANQNIDSTPMAMFASSLLGVVNVYPDVGGSADDRVWINGAMRFSGRNSINDVADVVFTANGSIVAEQSLYLMSDGNGSGAGSIHFGSDDEKVGSQTDHMVIEGTSGDVGIGIANPTNRLHVKDENSFPFFHVDNPGLYSSFILKASDDTNSFGLSSQHNLQFSARSTTQERAVASLRSGWIDDVDATRVSHLDFLVNNGSGFGTSLSLQGNKALFGASHNIEATEGIDIYNGALRVRQGTTALYVDETLPATDYSNRIFVSLAHAKSYAADLTIGEDATLIIDLGHANSNDGGDGFDGNTGFNGFTKKMHIRGDLSNPNAVQLNGYIYIDQSMDIEFESLTINNAYRCRSTVYCTLKNININHSTTAITANYATLSLEGEINSVSTGGYGLLVVDGNVHALNGSVINVDTSATTSTTGVLLTRGAFKMSTGASINVNAKGYGVLAGEGSTAIVSNYTQTASSNYGCLYSSENSFMEIFGPTNCSNVANGFYAISGGVISAGSTANISIGNVAGNAFVSTEHGVIRLYSAASCEVTGANGRKFNANWLGLIRNSGKCVDNSATYTHSDYTGNGAILGL